MQAIKQDPFEDLKPLIAARELPCFSTPLGSASIADQTTLLLTHGNASFPTPALEVQPSISELSVEIDVDHELALLSQIMDFDFDDFDLLPSDLPEPPPMAHPQAPLQQQPQEQQILPCDPFPFSLMELYSAFPEVPVPMPAQALDVEATVERERVPNYKLKEAEEQHSDEELGRMLIDKKDRFPEAMRSCAEATGKMLAYGFKDSTRKSAAGQKSKHDHLTKTAVRCLFIERGKLVSEAAAEKATAIHRCGRSAKEFKGLIGKTLRQRCL